MLKVAFTAGAFAVLALAGCSGSSGPASVPVVCPTPVIPTFALVTPASGSAGVSPAVGAIVVSASSVPQGAVLITVSGPQPVISGAAATAVASPPAGSIEYSVPLPALASGTSYAVTASFNIFGVTLGKTPCLVDFPQSVGTFTTR